MPEQETFDLRETYLHLHEGGAADRIAVTETFWPEVMSGQRRLDGRLVMIAQMREATAHWERHPAGEELLYRLSGAVDVIVEEADGERRIPLRDGSPGYVVPAGVWHRFEVLEPGDILFITPGEGTAHKPV